MTEKRQVEWTEEPSVKIGTAEYLLGDRTTLDKAEADQYIALGWCKCVATGETGTRKAGAVKLEVHDQKLSLK